MENKTNKGENSYTLRDSEQGSEEKIRFASEYLGWEPKEEWFNFLRDVDRRKLPLEIELFNAGENEKVTVLEIILKTQIKENMFYLQDDNMNGLYLLVAKLPDNEKVLIPCWHKK